MRVRQTASTVEQLAQQIGVGRGLLDQHQPLCCLPQEQAHALRQAARVALADRDFPDALLWSRDLFAQFQYNRTFDHLTSSQQLAVAQIVSTIGNAVLVYLTGDAEPLNDWTRAQAQIGATQSDWFETHTAGRVQ